MTKPSKLSPEEQQDLDNRLIDAAAHGNTQTVRTLLWAGADVHGRNDLALPCAAENGHTEIVKALLSAGADVHAWNDAAFCWAAYYGHTETLRVLLRRLARVTQ
jgi:ankyrin repeat protein